MRWLLLKDLQILRRSPLLLALLVAYAVVIGLPVGYGISAPPSKPKVAFYNGVPSSENSFELGGRKVDASQYAEELFEDIDPIRVGSREEAIAKVKDGEALGALVVPEDITEQLRNATELPGISEPPTLEVFYNADNPLKRRYVEQTVKARLADANLALSGEVTKVAAEALDVLLAGGPFALPTGSIDVLGLRRAKAVLEGAQRGLPEADPQRAAIQQVVEFADVAITSLNFANPVLGAIAAPIRVDTTEVTGDNGTLEGFAVAGGLEIALSCDLIVAAEGARMGIPEVKRSLVAAGGALLRLPRRMPYHVVMELALTGDPMPAERFHAFGVVNRLTAPGGALDGALELAGALARNGPLALAASKQILMVQDDWSSDEMWARQGEIAGPVLGSDDAREGATAFKERREPVWRGR